MSHIQILVLGQSNVGKTVIVNQLCEINSIIFGSEDTSKSDIDDGSNPSKRVHFTEVTRFQFPSFQKLGIKVSDAFTLTYAVDDKASYDYATSLIDEIINIKGPDVPVIIAANKTDLEHFDAYADTAEWAEIIYTGCKHVEVCAIDGEGTKDLFSCLLGYFGQYLTYSKKNVTIPMKKGSLLSRLSKCLWKIFPKKRLMSH